MATEGGPARRRGAWFRRGETRSEGSAARSARDEGHSHESGVEERRLEGEDPTAMLDFCSLVDVDVDCVATPTPEDLDVFLLYARHRC